jgi:hypothetical protein
MSRCARVFFFRLLALMAVVMLTAAGCPSDPQPGPSTPTTAMQTPGPSIPGGATIPQSPVDPPDPEDTTATLDCPVPVPDCPQPIPTPPTGPPTLPGLSVPPPPTAVAPDDNDG